MRVTISATSKVWSSPDGERVIYQVAYPNEAGTTITRKTWSEALGTGQGKEFDIEEYSKDSKDGSPEIWVKQVSKGGGRSYGGGAKEYKADPEKQASIERQSYLKTAVELAGLYYTANKMPAGTTFESLMNECVARALYAMNAMNSNASGDVTLTEQEQKNLTVLTAPTAAELAEDDHPSGDAGML